MRHFLSSSFSAPLGVGLILCVFFCGGLSWSSQAKPAITRAYFLNFTRDDRRIDIVAAFEPFPGAFLPEEIYNEINEADVVLFERKPRSLVLPQLNPPLSDQSKERLQAVLGKNWPRLNLIKRYWANYSDAIERQFFDGLRSHALKFLPDRPLSGSPPSPPSTVNLFLNSWRYHQWHSHEFFTKILGQYSELYGLARAKGKQAFLNPPPPPIRAGDPREHLERLLQWDLPQIEQMQQALVETYLDPQISLGASYELFFDSGLKALYHWLDNKDIPTNSEAELITNWIRQTAKRSEKRVVVVLDARRFIYRQAIAIELMRHGFALHRQQLTGPFMIGKPKCATFSRD